ncbi:MAG: thioredoxin-dependent thiol peroxidase [Anaerolineales bacterium]|nr:thioredoxin-dependent thiol peroxidase [Anaerolineales bacterium]
MTPTSGDRAPDFELLSDTGEPVKLSDYRGRYIVLYFYPRADTPSCTKEACGFRDDYSVYQEKGVVILGVSPDTVKQQAKFKAKYDLPFTLLDDTNHQISEAYDVWGLKKFMGREFMGVKRTTFLIDPDGEIVERFENVKPAEHSKEILDTLERALEP